MSGQLFDHEVSPEEARMRAMLVWMVEQACRLADEQVCAMANLTDDCEMAE